MQSEVVLSFNSDEVVYLCTIIAEFNIAMLTSPRCAALTKLFAIGWFLAMHTIEQYCEASEWILKLDTGDGHISVPLELGDKEGESFLRNGPERIKVAATWSNSELRISFPHYASSIECKKEGDAYKGSWTKLRGKGEKAVVDCEIVPRRNSDATGDPSPFWGRWKVQFSDSEDPAVAVFDRFHENEVAGTFLTTTGDYRYLHGRVINGTLHLSCFDGAHAFLFQSSVDSEGKQTGTFRSGNWYVTQWEAIQDETAKLPDAFKETSQAAGKFSDLSFPDLDGKRRSMREAGLFGQVTLVELFGSWCPNCHDEASYLQELQAKYGTQGLKVIGLAFELTGNLESDIAQVRKYVKRFEIEYPVLVAGVADKREASKSFPVLDRIRSYPTTLFVDRKGEIRAIYTGFSGPATGQAHLELREKFERVITQLLDE